jgi:hypothetical protein
MSSAFKCSYRHPPEQHNLYFPLNNKKTQEKNKRNTLNVLCNGLASTVGKEERGKKR